MLNYQIFDQVLVIQEKIECSDGRDHLSNHEQFQNQYVHAAAEFNELLQPIPTRSKS